MRLCLNLVVKSAASERRSQRVVEVKSPECMSQTKKDVKDSLGSEYLDY